MPVSKKRKRKKKSTIQYAPKQILVPGTLPDGTEVVAKVKLNKFNVIKHKPNGQ